MGRRAISLAFSIDRRLENTRNIDIEKNWNTVVNTINEVAEEYANLMIVMSTHPRTQKKIMSENVIFKKNVLVHAPFGLFDFIHLQRNAFCVISDSGTISEEAAILQIPAISFRICTERPEAIEKGNIILSGLEGRNLLHAIRVTIHRPKSPVPLDYVDINISDKIINVILSYATCDQSNNLAKINLNLLSTSKNDPKIYDIRVQQ